MNTGDYQRGKARQRKLGSPTAATRNVLALNWLALLLAVLLLAVAGCSSGFSADGEDSPPGPEARLRVFAAASLAEAFQEIGAAFEAAHRGRYAMEFNFDGSQRLRTQLELGARADVFASADQKQMDLAEGAGLLRGEPVSFAGNRLVVIVPASGTPAAGVQGLADLAGEGVRLVLALPEVPAGGYARAVIDKIDASGKFGPRYARRVLDNVVSQETNVRNVVQKVALGEVDAGIVYETDARAEQAAQSVAVIPIPARFNVVAEYWIATLRDSTRPELAEAFVQFVQSEPGQEILRDHGFGKAP